MEPSTQGRGERSDVELLRAARADPRAFEIFVEQHAMLLLRWLSAQTSDNATARELLAEAFAQAWLGVRRFRGGDQGSGSAWLFGIARNLLRQHRRRGRLEDAARRRLGITAPRSHDDEAEQIFERIDAHQLAPVLREAFSELTPAQQRAVSYRVLDELSYEEIAARLNCTTTTARSRVFRGLRTLRATVAKGAQP